jgi:hypothetical protein
LFFASESILAAKPIENLIDVAVPMHADGTFFSMDEVKEAIIAGCAKKGWIPVLAENGRFTASIQVRSHTANIEIPYSEKAYSILYVSSTNLDYNEKKQKIHRNYNKWVILLSRAIQEDLAGRI